ncbi:MAG: hypothetical protein OEX00_06710 [Gammaproteobacteria bacterium]|nr:hypothetical protein [Gammaproteobacteria bacterium]
MPKMSSHLGAEDRNTSTLPEVRKMVGGGKMSIFRRVLNKLHGCSGLVLFEEDVRNPAIEKLKQRTKLKVVRK